MKNPILTFSTLFLVGAVAIQTDWINGQQHKIAVLISRDAAQSKALEDLLAAEVKTHEQVQILTNAGVSRDEIMPLLEAQLQFDKHVATFIGVVREQLIFPANSPALKPL